MRILGITVPDEKQLWVGLTVFYGIGFSTARKILKTANVAETKIAKEISTEEEGRIRKLIEDTLKKSGAAAHW